MSNLDLLSMGYRPLGTNGFGVTVYAKPFGYTLLVIAIKGDDLTLAQHFKGNEDKPLVWETIKYDPIKDGTIVQWVRYVECFNVRTGIGYGSPRSDEYTFLTREQQLDALLTKAERRT